MSFDGLKHWAMTHPQFILAVQIPMAGGGLFVAGIAPAFEDRLDPNVVLRLQCVGLAIFATFTLLALSYSYQHHQYQQRLNEIRISRLTPINSEQGAIQD